MNYTTLKLRIIKKTLLILISILTVQIQAQHSPAIIRNMERARAVIARQAKEKAQGLLNKHRPSAPPKRTIKDMGDALNKKKPSQEKLLPQASSGLERPKIAGLIEAPKPKNLFESIKNLNSPILAFHPDTQKYILKKMFLEELLKMVELFAANMKRIDNAIKGTSDKIDVMLEKDKNKIIAKENRTIAKENRTKDRDMGPLTIAEIEEIRDINRHFSNLDYREREKARIEALNKARDERIARDIEMMEESLLKGPLALMRRFDEREREKARIEALNKARDERIARDDEKDKNALKQIALMHRFDEKKDKYDSNKDANKATLVLLTSGALATTIAADALKEYEEKKAAREAAELIEQQSYDKFMDQLEAARAKALAQ